MTKEQAIAIIEEKRTWADLISGEKDELYDAIDVVLVELASLRTRLEAIEKAGEAVPPKNVPVWCMQAAQDISISGAIVARPHLEHVRIDVSDMARTIALRLRQEYDRFLLYLDEHYPSLSCPHCGSGRLQRDVPNGPDSYNCLECGQFTRGGIESFTFTREKWEKDILPRLFGDGTGTITERQ